MAASLEGLPLELSTQIIVYLPLIDRLALRICCSALEKAVAASDLLLPRDEITIKRSHPGDLSIQIGRIRVHADSLSELCRFRRRIGNKISAHELIVARNETVDSRVDDFLADFLEGCEVNVMSIHLHGEPSRNFREYIMQNSNKQMWMKLERTSLDEELLRSFLHDADIVFMSPAFTISTDLFLVLLKRGDFIYGAPISSVRQMLEIAKIYSDTARDDQHISFGVGSRAFNEFKIEVAGKEEWSWDESRSDNNETWTNECGVDVSEQPESEKITLKLHRF
ncbi:hypothetical protein PMAYCL1PPCAC_03282 [Pristionchus mayeri]|uniref:F-box domain-containing protein n=1 Tax=Pristionchus mayeri TaxID=1317129 RepID=A0AAN4Z864_9BILA|nr:hypothetical protein PMAYCL1PPCAC_03282 [Pristionchus mayeri]